MICRVLLTILVATWLTVEQGNAETAGMITNKKETMITSSKSKSASSISASSSSSSSTKTVVKSTLVKSKPTRPKRLTTPQPQIATSTESPVSAETEESTTYIISTVTPEATTEATTESTTELTTEATTEAIAEPTTEVVVESPSTTTETFIEYQETTTETPLEISSSTTDDSPKCIIRKQIVQLAFVVDITRSMKNKFPIFINESKSIMIELGQRYPHVSFALTTNANWDESCFKKQEGINGHTNMATGCYNPHIKFTSNPEEFAAQAATVKAYGGRMVDNAVHATAFTAADTSLGWRTNISEDNTETLKKLLVVITDATSITALDFPGNRTAFRGDGSDTCQTSLPLSIEELKRTLAFEDMSVIGFYETNLIRRHYDEEWYSKAGVAHCSNTWKNDFHNIVKVVQNCVSSILDECVYEDPKGIR